MGNNGGDRNVIELLWSYRGMFGNALLVTLLIAVAAIAIGLVIGLICASVRVAPKTNIVIRIADKIVGLYIMIIRGTPTLLQLLIIANVIMLPIYNAGTNILVPMVAFGINSGAYMAEIFRSGFNSVDRGQLEAGRSLGLSWLTTTTRIIIPQAVKTIIPTIFNEIIILVKETSVVSYVAIFIGGIQVYDLLGMADKQGLSTGEYLAFLVTAALIYLVVVLVLTLIQKIIERRFGRSDRR